MNKIQSPLEPKSRPGQPAANRFSAGLTRPFWICVLLAVVTATVYWPAVGFDYVNYDDPEFILTNPHILGGLTWENVQWAFGTGRDGNWIPLTWLSYMLDVDCFGTMASGLHLTNIFLHSANTVLIFLLFRRLTGKHWPSAVLAGLFGLHPLHVESVAWISERKDVLSTLFWSLAIWTYAGYAQKLAAGSRHWLTEYLLALTFFALGLMCKPMVVTLPFVLLLLDHWPLQRIKPGDIFAHRASVARLLGEKIPFFIFAAIVSALTIVAQLQGRAMVPLANYPFGARISNALVAYLRYLEKTFWPVDLTNPYPLTRHWPWGPVITAGALILGLTVLAILAARKRPYSFVGWLWFLGTMIPVIGLVQVGVQSMADRYTYIPLLGVFWIVVWAATDLIARWRLSGRVVVLATLLVLGTCMARTRAQLDYWRDGESLFRHAIAVTENNFVAFDGLGRALYNKGQLDEAVFYYLKSLEIRPRYEDALNNLNDTLIRIDVAYAINNHPSGLTRRIEADYASAHNTLGLGLTMNGRLDDAIPHFRKALFYEFDNVNARSNLGHALALQGRLDEAIGQCAQILRQSPHHPAANNTLGLVLLKQGRWNEGAAYLREALQYEPDFAEAHFNLGQALAALGQRDEAIEHFKETLRLNPNYQDAREQLRRLEGVSP